MTLPLVKDDLNFPKADQPELRVITWSSTGNEIQVGIVTKDNAKSVKITPNSNNTKKLDRIALTDIPTHINVKAVNTSSRRGETYVRIDLDFGRNISANLLEGYVSSTTNLTLGMHEDSISGKGIFKVITGTNPAANVEITQTVPANRYWVLHSMNYTLVTDANAATRRVSLNFSNGSSIYLTLVPSISQIESLTQTYNWTAQGDQQGVQDLHTNQILPNTKIVLPAGHIITTVTSNRQVGDDFGAPLMFVEEFVQD